MNKNKNILILTITLLTLVLVTAPLIGTVEANRYRKRCGRRRITIIEGVTVTSERTPMFVGDPQIIDGIILNRGISTGEVTLNIPGEDPLVGDWDSTWISRVINPDFPDANPEGKITLMGMMVWTFTGEGTTGTFFGETRNELIGYPFPTATYTDVQMKLQGTGDFRGQTLKLSYQGVPGEGSPTGNLIIRK